MKVLAGAIPVILAITGTVSVYVWLSADAGEGQQVRLPGADGRPDAARAATDEAVKISGRLVKFDGVPSDLPGA